MKINETIRKKRKDLGLTQEQVAEYLNITTPAVNKWEKGNTYPDITLLPALARILKTDLNDLLAFNEDLADVEITNFANKIERLVREQDYPSAFEITMNKIAEYPTCEKLIASLVPYLDGALYMYSIEESDKYKVQLDALYKRIANSEVPQVRELAISMMIARNMEQENYEVAESLINSLPSPTIDKDSRLAALYNKQKKYAEATEIWQSKLFKLVSEMQSPLLGLMHIALEENRPEDANFLAEKYDKFAEEFFPIKWIRYTAQLELSVKTQDRLACIDILKKIMSCMKENKVEFDMPLYSSVISTTIHRVTNQFLMSMTKQLQSSHEFDFLRDMEEFQDILKNL